MPDTLGGRVPPFVYATPGRARLARALLRAASAALGTAVRLEVLASGGVFRRLHLEAGSPRADLVFADGPYMALAAARDDFLEPYQPASAPPAVPGAVSHEPGWRWTTVDFSPFTLVGKPPTGTLDEAGTLAIPDPARHEDGVMLLLAMLDSARQRGEDETVVWSYWQRRAQSAGLSLLEDPENGAPAVPGGMGHFLLRAGPGGTPLVGLAPLPNAVGLVKNAPRQAQARALLDWLAGPEAARVVGAGTTLSQWGADANGLAGLARGAPPLDLDWTFAQYRATRQTWLARGLSPAVALNRSS